MFRKNEVLTYLGWTLMCCVVVYTCTSCVFPTNDDVNNMQESNQTFNQGLHDAGNKLMTDQHSAMTPELAEAFVLMNSQYVEISAELKRQAGTVKAQGADVGGLLGGGGIWEVIGMMFPGFAGIGLWIQNLLKPSRASGQVAALEGEAKAMANELKNLKHQLATAAGAGDAVTPGLVVKD